MYFLSQISTWKSLTVISRRQRRTSLGASRFSGEDARVKLSLIVDEDARRYIFWTILERDIREGEPWIRSFCKYERDLYGFKRAIVKIWQL